MFLYRLCSEKHTDLDGIGGLLVTGRWNARGVRVVYLSEHRSLTILEKLVHISDTSLEPTGLIILGVEIPDHIFERRIRVKQQGKNWQKNQLRTRHIGTEFLNMKNSLLLEVPSAIVPEENNYLFNPLHPDAMTCKITDVNNFSFDKRLLY